ncbi:protease complex subunit PrcB family protein [Flavobacterium psychrotolerans]|uniref:PrcB C-terminal domain-containing protein n=1 Tax=Flavobacterium psychrotolerans TaxID=2169410 RepID=A0A2U1JGG0_9FLAO|nr:protease complex subunit PrcB family protein [Flavobacterium psychrotolerans]PWA04084.1 hypothetical protein DB895_12905 [Flavobacterium psychrotolerans]
MNKIVIACVTLILFSCGSTTKSVKKPLFEVLTQQNDGGARIRFFEVLSETREIKMLLNDDNLKKKIKPTDVNTCNFIILNMGEKNANGYSITIGSVEETSDKIIFTTKEKEPRTVHSAEPIFVYPYAIVKINSKKEIVFK